MEPHFTSSAGPNGPHALLRSHLDALAVKREGLTEKIFNLFDKLHPDDPFIKEDLSMMASLSEELGAENIISSRLHFISEGGGKTRVVAICDY